MKDDHRRIFFKKNIALKTCNKYVTCKMKVESNEICLSLF